MSVRIRRGRVSAGLMAAGLLAGLLSAPAVAQAAPVVAAPIAAGPDSTMAAALAEPTNLATPEQKVKAAAEIGVVPDAALLLMNDQAFVLEIWRRAKEGSYVKAEAWRAYDTADAGAAYAFITTGIFNASHDDALVDYAAAQAKARRSSVAVTVGLDPSDIALIEKNDRDFIFSVWQRVTAGSHVWTAAQQAIADGTGQAEWDVFLDTGAAAAAEQDLREAIEKANEAEAERLRAEQLVAAKQSLLQLLLLPVTTELVNAPDRQFVLHVYTNAKGAEVKLSAQTALNAPDAQLAQSLKDYIFTGGAAANRRDEDAAAAKELAAYRERVIPIRDAAKHDGFAPALLAAADKALTDNTLIALQTFLLKGQDEARAKDRRLDFATGFEAADSRPNWQNTADGISPGGGSVNVGGIVSTVTTAELGVRDKGARTGTYTLMYSGMDNSATRSFNYNQAFALTNVAVRTTSTLSYWIYPQSSATFGQVSGSNSTCVAIDMVFGDGTSLRDRFLKDQNGNEVHPARQCGRLTLDTWNEVVVDLGSQAGKVIKRVDVGYDQPANTGGYRGFIDDLKISDLESGPKFGTSLEAGDPAPQWTNTASSVKPGGGVSNVGGVVSSVTIPELFVGTTSPRTGAKDLLYSGKDNSTTSSYAYLKAYGLTDTYVSANTKLSYWIYPQSSTAFSWVSGSNSTCVAVDLILEDKISGATASLRDSGAKDARGNSIHPGGQCGKLPLDTWTQVVVPLAGVANGQRIAQIDVGYDQKANSGGYRGFIDDIRIIQ
ncbi:alpha-mannosidase [Actinoplanes rectilineatus]|uniref:alpha-mannosidase n=1 Tax=Actinoplanes rectilineatus TaxID=113571 RepID=UPI0009FAE29D|nr:alpha-mannosidase [Actinoplanes rectilineatus]